MKMFWMVINICRSIRTTLSTTMKTRMTISVFFKFYFTNYALLSFNLYFKVFFSMIFFKGIKNLKKNSLINSILLCKIQFWMLDKILISFWKILEKMTKNVCSWMFTNFWATKALVLWRRVFRWERSIICRKKKLFFQMILKES